ncbi:hypothetical protein Palpr_0015 [Paludibacter propionicigenes WB4]|uniref:Uncharacterized protein n=1 Tax=Paludibacter propionicigenes (strain DSM 17365 / JCM 13257 / WB4) TaxID=694427 RepID=E4T0C3_PALPW|nr:hypothetical protein Palpr_0015 [Paludibacter propionicigenes WB4]
MTILMANIVILSLKYQLILQYQLDNISSKPFENENNKTNEF